MEQPDNVSSNNPENNPGLLKNNSNTSFSPRNPIFIALSLITVVILVLGILFFVASKKTVQQNPAHSLPTKVTPTNFPEKVGNWATYSNLNQGFSVDYPSIWSVVSYHYDWKSFVQLPDDFNFEPAIALTPSLNKSQLEKAVGYLPGAEIQVSNLKKCTDSKDYINENLRYYRESYEKDPSFKRVYPDFKIEDLNVKDLDGFIVFDLPGPGGREGMPTAYIFNCPILITILFDESNIPDGIQVFHRMLSTIKVWEPVKLTPG